MARRLGPTGDALDWPLSASPADRLEELRRRVGVCLIALAVALFVAFFPVPFVTPIPLTQIVAAALSGPPPPTHVPWIRPGEGFRVYFQVAFLVMLVLTQPVVVWQTLAHYTPQGRPGRAGAIGAVVLASAAALASGLYIGFLTVRHAVDYLMLAILTHSSIGIPRYWPEQIVFTAQLVLLLGEACALATLMAGTAWLGVVSRGRLASWRRYAILAAVATAALVTPTSDVLSLAVAGALLYVPYEIGLLLARLVATAAPLLSRTGEGVGGEG